MKSIFSYATLVAVLAAIGSAAPLAPRSVLFTKGADFIRVTSEAEPQTDQISVFGTETAVISRQNGQNEFASYISFALPDAASIGATSSSTCSIVINNPAQSTGSQNTQVFSLGGGLFTQTGPLTFWQHPYHDQYRGVYQTGVGEASTAIDVTNFPCNFGQEMQFVFRPQNDNDYITWTQNTPANIGAFIQVNA
jgi:hypothetical protein